MTFGGQRNFLPALRDAVQDAQPETLQNVLAGPWHYSRTTNTLGLDPHARVQEGGYMGVDPSTARPQGVKGALVLARHGLAFFPLRPGNNGDARPSGYLNGYARWPVWEAPMRRAAVRALLCAPWLDQPAEKARAGLAAHGVVARYVASCGRRPMKSGWRLTTGTRDV